MIEQLIRVLEQTGYNCFVPLEKKSCFDLAARTKNRFLLIKVFSNIDSFKETQAQALKTLASALDAIPLVVGKKSKTYELQQGLVYDRYGITVVSPETLTAMLGGVLPKKRFFKGRIVAEINPKKLDEFSPSELAKELQVTREAIYAYKHGSRIEFDKAKKLEKIINSPLIKDINPFLVPEHGKQVLTGYLKKMSSLGFDVAPVHRGFDALATEKESLLMDSERSLAYAKQKTGFVKKAGAFFDSHPVIVMESSKHEVKGVPIITKKEITDSESAESLVDLVKKRKKK